MVCVLYGQPAGILEWASSLEDIVDEAQNWVNDKTAGAIFEKSGIHLA